jgi:hypothetical protein
MFTGLLVILLSIATPSGLDAIVKAENLKHLNNNVPVRNQNKADSRYELNENEIKDLVDGVVGYKKDGLWGLQNSKGEAITLPKYVSVEKINRFIKASLVGKTSGREFFGVITTEDEIIIPFE